MNKKILLSLLLGSVASPVLACGDSYAPLAEQIALCVWGQIKNYPAFFLEFFI